MSVAEEETAEAAPTATMPDEAHTLRRADLRTPKRKGKTIVDISRMEKLPSAGNLEVEEMSLGMGSEKQNPDDNKTNSEADTAAGKESTSSSVEEQCLDEWEKRWENKFKNPMGFLQKLHNEKGPSYGAMATACWDIKEQMELADAGDGQNFSFEEYSDDLLLAMREEKESVEELFDYLEELATTFQAKCKGLEEKRGGLGGERAEKEDTFEDARDTASITSLTSKTQHAALDSHDGKVTSAFPHPPEGEGGQQVNAAAGHGDG